MKIARLAMNNYFWVDIMLFKNKMAKHNSRAFIVKLTTWNNKNCYHNLIATITNYIILAVQTGNENVRSNNSTSKKENTRKSKMTTNYLFSISKEAFARKQIFQVTNMCNNVRLIFIFYPLLKYVNIIR